MSARTSSKRFFGLASCVSIAGAVLTVSTGALAACPDDDPGAIPFKSPPKAACTDADIAAFKTAAETKGNGPAEVEAALNAKNPACAACVFTKVEDAAWGPFVKVGTDGDGFFNEGACYERGPGGSATCAAAVFKFDTCIEARCSACADQAACYNTVSADANSCGKYDYESACPNIDALDDLCLGDDVVAIVKAVCGGAAEPDPDDKGSSSGKSSSSSSSGGEDDGSSSGNTSSGGGKKKPSSSGATPTEEAPASSSSCAQGPGSAGGSIASALVVAAAVGAAASRRRRKH